MPPPAPFATTLWTTILQARDGDSESRKSALDRLCARYWTPLYAYLLRKGLSRDDSQDAVQGFFAYFLEKELLKKVDPGRGRFRRYLLAVLEHWLANERRLATAQKRGGFDFGSAHRTLSVDPAAPADEAYRRTWALEVLRDAMGRLKREYHDLGRSRRFEAVASHLAAGADRSPTEEIARRLGISNDDVYRLVHEARRRLQEHVRAVLRDTVETDAEVDEEIADLFGR